MKKFLLLSLIALFIVSCGTSKKAREARKTFDGDWTLTSVTYPENTGDFNVTLLNDARATCFEGGTWDFTSNNNRGTYNLLGDGCGDGDRQFIWSIEEENASEGVYNFLLKPTNEDYQSITGDQGFRLNLKSLSESSMVWEQTVRLEGEPFVIRMNFRKL